MCFRMRSALASTTPATAATSASPGGRASHEPHFAVLFVDVGRAGDLLERAEYRGPKLALERLLADEFHGRHGHVPHAERAVCAGAVDVSVATERDVARPFFGDLFVERLGADDGKRHLVMLLENRPKIGLP